MTATKEKFHPLKSWWPLLTQSFSDWSEDCALRFAAALAYYAVFSLTPLIIIAIAVAGLIFGEEAARGQIFHQIKWLLGEKGAAEIQSLLQVASDKPKSLLATVIGIGTLLIGACGVFAQLKDALNAIWGVALKPGYGIRGMAKDYLLSFSMVLAVGFLLIVSLLISAVMQAINNYMTGLVPLPAFVGPLAGLFSIVLLTVLFALIFKILPDAQIGWRDVWIGAAVTALLFTIGKSLIGLYLGTSSIASSFGAAGALILILVWIYYSTTIFLLGAEFTKVYAVKYGCGIVPAPNARFVTEKMRNEQGLPKKEEPLSSH